ncbi:MAG TPA: ester cyclase [Anaerolineales bacterium]
MTSDLATYAEMINEAWNSHDIEKVLSFYSQEYVGDDVGQASLLRGHEGLRAMLESYWGAFPDLRFKVVSTLVDGNRIAIVWVGDGTHHGTIMNIPPTGHKVTVRGVSIIDVKDKMVVSGQYIWDLAGMLRHMGLLPEL